MQENRCMEKHTKRIGNNFRPYVYNKSNEISFLKPLGTGQEKKISSGSKRSEKTLQNTNDAATYS